jgi:hypothetical protein
MAFIVVMSASIVLKKKCRKSCSRPLGRDGAKKRLLHVIRPDIHPLAAFAENRQVGVAKFDVQQLDKPVSFKAIGELRAC